MRLLFIALVACATFACLACYHIGYRSGTEASPLRTEREGQVIYSLAAHKALAQTNLMKVRSLVDTELLCSVRDYEKRFTTPKGPALFARRFVEAKAAADQIEKQMVSASVVQQAASSALPQRSGK